MKRKIGECASINKQTGIDLAANMYLVC